MKMSKKTWNFPGGNLIFSWKFEFSSWKFNFSGGNLIIQWKINFPNGNLIIF
jgi:hypothetical protein